MEDCGKIIDRKMQIFKLLIFVPSWGENRNVYILAFNQNDAQTECYRFFKNCRLMDIQQLMAVDIISDSVVKDILQKPTTKAFYEYLQGKTNNLPVGVMPNTKEDQGKDFYDLPDLRKLEY